MKLSERVEALTGPDRALNREIALAVGWHRYSPSEIGKSNPGWIAPEDFIGEYVRKDGKRTRRLDSLHGTDIWREPKDFLGSLDAAVSLVPEGWTWTLNATGAAMIWDAIGCDKPIKILGVETPALALCAAALKARGL